MVINTDELVRFFNKLQKLTKSDLTSIISFISDNELCYEGDVNSTLNLNGYLEISDIFRKHLIITVNEEAIDLTFIKSMTYNTNRKTITVLTIYDQEYVLNIKSNVKVNLIGVPFNVFLKYFN